MATDEALRGTGLGMQLMQEAERFVRQTDVRLLWCNARVPAIGFYLRAGWEVVSPEFDIPTAGPHVRMLRKLEE
jgi:GNAT superfamily N-acetyltransferase